MGQAIDEKDIFGALIRAENSTVDEVKEVSSNIAFFLSKVPFNIFNNEYYALYEAISRAKKYNGVLSYQIYNEIVLNNIERLMKSPNINFTDFSDDPEDEMQTKKDFLTLCMSTYMELAESEVAEEIFRFSTELFVQRFIEDEYSRIYTDCSIINLKGKTIKGKYLQGSADSSKYYAEQHVKLQSLITIDGDVAQTFDISPEGFQKFQDMKKSSPVRKVSNTGIDSLDTMIGDFRKGDVITIQGPTSAGKTRFAVNVAYNAIRRGHNGVIFALEGKVAELFALFTARHIVEEHNGLPIDSKQIYERSYPEKVKDIVEAAEYDLFHNPNYGRLKIILPPLYGEDVVPKLEAIWDNEMQFNFVMLDYASLMMSRHYKNITETLENTIPRLKTSASTFKGDGYLFLLVQQLKVEAYEQLKKGVDSTLFGASDSSIIPKSSDVVLTVYTDDELKLKNKIQIFGSKIRDSVGFSSMECYALLGNCFYRDLAKE